MEWNEDTIVRLRALWDEGHSTAEIGRRLGVSKNAVVGKAHRLGLPARPSPIRREGDRPARPAAPRRMTGPTLPPLPAAAPVAPSDTPPHASAPPAERAVPPPPPRPMRVVTPRIGRGAACCWPLGEPGTPSFHFCDADALTGKPYCAAHAQVAYVRVRDRREEAA